MGRPQNYGVVLDDKGQFTEDGILYAGGFTLGYMNGNGVRRYANGEEMVIYKYAGKWKNNEPTEGINIFAGSEDIEFTKSDGSRKALLTPEDDKGDDQKLFYSGKYLEGRYYGAWKKRKPEGYGVLKLHGSKCITEWKRSESGVTAKGILIYPNGDIFNGEFAVNDVGDGPQIKFIGKWTITRANGNLFVCNNPKQRTGTMTFVEHGSKKEAPCLEGYFEQRNTARRRAIEEMKEEDSSMSYMMQSSTKSYMSPLSNNSLYITMLLMALIAMIMSSIFIVWHR